MSPIASILAAILVLQPPPEPAGAPPADMLAERVMRASGSEVWPRVTRIRFTFNVERDGKTVASVKHDWDVRAGTDTVTTGNKSVAVDVRRADHADDDEKQAYGRFINDSYWLLAPLKLKDPGVKLSTGQPQQIEGKEYWLLHLSFDGVGLTPSDQYNLWIDPQTHLVGFWDYIPEPGKSARMSWEDYRDFNGLKLATRHVSPRATIAFTDVEVTVE
jgi:hypothetical protein